jgi:hypothetical protein
LLKIKCEEKEEKTDYYKKFKDLFKGSEFENR